MKHLLLISLFCIGCADPRTYKGIDASFNNHVALFESLYGHTIGEVAINFGTLSYPTAGECNVYHNIYKEIIIDKDYWDSHDDNSKTGLLFHELGHCVLGRNHDDTLMNYNGRIVPRSLMYHENFYSNNYGYLEEYYFKEMFGE